MLIEKFNIKDYIMRLSYVILLLSVTFVINSCNSGNPTEVPPAFVQLLQAPNENEIITVSSVSFIWRGSEEKFQFRYRLLSIDNNSAYDYIDWTSYTSLTEIEFKNLDEGKYRFELEGKNLGFVGSPLTRTFFIDAVKGPSVSFNKLETKSNIGKIDSVSIWMEDVDSLTAFNFVINFNPKIINVVSVNSGKYITDNNFNQIILPDFSNSSVLTTVNKSGRLEVNSAVLMTLTSFPYNYVSGSGKILNIKFKGIAKGTTNLEFIVIELKKLDGTKINNGKPGLGVYKIE
ncbi:MAG: hypothetical protein V1773_04255 [bacterium]